MSSGISVEFRGGAAIVKCTRCGLKKEYNETDFETAEIFEQTMSQIAMDHEKSCLAPPKAKGKKEKTLDQMDKERQQKTLPKYGESKMTVWLKGDEDS